MSGITFQDWEREFCSRVAEGKTPTQAAWMVLQKYPDLLEQGVTARELARLSERPAFQELIQELGQTDLLIDRYEMEISKLQATVMGVQEQIANFCHMSLDIISTDGLDAMKGIIKDKDMSARQRTEAMKVLLAGFKTMAPYSGLFHTEKTLHGQERVATPQGMSPALTAEILKAMGLDDAAIERLMRESAIEVQAN